MSDPVYFHGGVAGLYPGDRILPPATTGRRASRSFLPDDLRGDADHVREDRVYLTTDVEIARMYAGLHPDGTRKRGGDLYRVTPEGPVEPDPDWLGGPGMSVQAVAAWVLGIVKTGVPRRPFLAFAQMVLAEERRAGRV